MMKILTIGANAFRPFEWKSRLKASMVHATISLAVAALVALLVFGLWFPGDYRQFSGGTELFELVVGVDLVIGPCITFAVFSRSKSLRAFGIDFAVIAALQLSALAYGLQMVSISRPVAMALEEDRFRVVSALDVYEPELALASPEYQTMSLTGPKLVRSVLPADPVGRSDALTLAFRGHDIGTRPLLWRPWNDTARAEALAHARPVSTLAKKPAVDQLALAHAVAATGLGAEQLVFIPMITFRGDWVALLDAKSGNLMGFAQADGFS
jgi:hypothetical protein